MAPHKLQHTLAQRHMRLFACTDCDSPCSKFIWQNDKTEKISRRVQLATLEAEDWIHDEETEKWVTGIENTILELYERIEQGMNPIILPGRVQPGSPSSVDIRVPLWNYVASIMNRRCMKPDFDKLLAQWRDPDYIGRLTANRCRLHGESWETAMNAVIHHIARMMENAKAVRGHLERRILDPDDCPFGELFLYQTLGDIALPDIGFCQKNQFVIMPVSPTNAFIATIGPYKGDFIWPRSDFPAVREEPNAPDDAVTTTRIMEWAEEESSSRFLYSRKPLYGVVKDCCPRLRPENRTPGLR